MNKILFIRNLLLIKKNYIKYLILLLITPMILYLFNVLPFADNSIKIWSSVGIWISSCLICSYVYMYDNISSYRIEKYNSNFILNCPISPAQIIISGITLTLIISLSELIIAYFLTYTLNNVAISFVDFLLLIINIFPIIMFFSCIAILSGMYANYNFGFFICIITSISVIQFCQISSLNDVIYIKYIPILGIISNCLDFLEKESIMNSGPILIMYLISILFLFLSSTILSQAIYKHNAK